MEGKVYLFFDEIQEVMDWEKCINSLRVALDCDIYITGSNAKLLSGELATYLGGRYVEFVIYPFSFAEFLEASRHAGHKVLLLSCYSGDALCARIAADETKKTVCIENLATDYLKLPFGKNPNPSWADYQHFLEDRCIPKTRAGLQEYLEAIGVDRYEPLEIIRKTHGRMAGDDLWLTVEELK